MDKFVLIDPFVDTVRIVVLRHERPVFITAVSDQLV